MKKLGFAVISTVLTLLGLLTLSACGKVNGNTIEKFSALKPYTVRLLVNIDFNTDTEIYLKADEVKVDREKMKVIIKGGLISDYHNAFMFGIGIADETTFYFPLGGGEIEIWGPGGLYQKITESSFEEKKAAGTPQKKADQTN